jgi:hypothetical protein
MSAKRMNATLDIDPEPIFRIAIINIRYSLHRFLDGVMRFGETLHVLHIDLIQCGLCLSVRLEVIRHII